MLVQPPSLLITDDDRDFRETLQGVFEPEGFRTILAGDGEEALRVVRTQEVHLLLLDVHMPRLTGLETLRRIRLLKAGLPCILWSALLDDRIIEQARLQRAFSVLPKPFTRGQITSIVRQVLRRTYNWQG